MKPQFIVNSLFLATLTTTTGVFAADPACTGGLNPILGILAQDPSIQAYCTASYPIYTTSTSTQTSFTVTTPTTITTTVVTQTVTADGAQRFRGRQIVSAALTPLAILQAQGKTAISTFCSCNQKPQTVRTTTVTTVTNTASSFTSTSISTTTVTVAPPKCASPGSNLIQNSGFENGLTGWTPDILSGSISTGSPGENSANSAIASLPADGKLNIVLAQSGILVRGGIAYTITWSGATSSPGGSQSISLGVLDANGKTIGTSQLLTNKLMGYQWGQTTFTITPRIDTTIKVRIQYLSSQTSLFADNVSMICS